MPKNQDEMTNTFTKITALPKKYKLINRAQKQVDFAVIQRQATVMYKEITFYSIFSQIWRLMIGVEFLLATIWSNKKMVISK